MRSGTLGLAAMGNGTVAAGIGMGKLALSNLVN